MTTTSKRVRPGIEVLLSDKLASLHGQRIGLVCNQASVLPDFRHSADVFSDHPDINLTILFGPQHGIRGDVQYNMIETPHVRDTRTGLMVYSLYSETRVPTEEMVADIDTFVIDLQDVGCRIYTYTYTMANCMIAAAKFGKRIIVCDRPNPINGVTVEGNVTEKEFTSFVGQFELPTRPGMTIGEMARMFNEHWDIGCELEIIEMEGWRREMWHEETGIPWVLPSPNIPTIDTCAVFPATVHLEGTELSEGRGTTLPFELNGAPFIDPYAWAEELRKFNFPGVAFREAYFQPTFCEFAGQTCGGIHFHTRHRRHCHGQNRLRYVPRPFPMAPKRLRIRIRQKPLRRRLRNRQDPQGDRCRRECRYGGLGLWGKTCRVRWTTKKLLVVLEFLE